VVGLEVNTKNTKYVFVFLHQSGHHNLLTANKSFENMAKMRTGYLWLRVGTSCQHDNEPSIYINGGEFIG